MTTDNRDYAEGFDYFYPPTYAALLNKIGRVVLCESFGSYDGDYYVLFQSRDQYGYLTFSYGSCSGCDALEACEAQEDVDRLQERLAASTKWGTAKDVVEWFLAAGDRHEFYYYYPQDFVVFAKKMIATVGLNELDFPSLAELESGNGENTSSHE
jgi:hypothetical protein